MKTKEKIRTKKVVSPFWAEASVRCPSGSGDLSFEKDWKVDRGPPWFFQWKKRISI